MNPYKNLIILFLAVILSVIFPQKAKCNAENYDRLISKSIPSATTHISTNEPEDLTLDFEHNKFPPLDGTWLLSRNTIKRKINPVLTKPISFIHCTSVLPFERRDFKDKEVVINSRGPDFFVIKSKQPVSSDIYFDPNQKTEIAYENYGLKGVIDEEDLTYAYTLKLANHIYDAPRARQLWLNGKLKYDFISINKITAMGYEIEYTPECTGFIMDEIEFQLVRDTGPPIFGKGPPLVTNIPPDIKYLEKPDTAVDKSDFEAADTYKPIDNVKNPQEEPIKVPGLW